MNRKRILYIAPYPSATFVVRDIELLSERYEVIFPSHQWNKSWMTPLMLIIQLGYLLRNARRVETIIVMFGGYWSLLPSLIGKLFKKPVLIILGGADCVSFPSIHYGSLRKPFMRAFIRYSYKYASCLVPVHGSLVHGENKYVRPEDSAVQGFKHFFPELKTAYRVVFNGFSSSEFQLSKTHSGKRKNAFVTVSSIPSYQRYILKGIDFIMIMARELPESTFTIVGMTKEFSDTLQSIPDNVTLINFIPIEQCIELMSDHEFYLQLSLSEGFPNSLCEAMLLECIPIGSSVGGIPDIIGDTGVVIVKPDVTLMINEIRQLKNLSNSQRSELSMRARERIKNNFSPELRQQQLFDLIDSAS